MRRRILISVFAFVAVALLAAPTLLAPARAAAVTSDVIAVQSIDTSGWPKVTVTVVLPPSMLGAGALASGDFKVTENGAALAGVKASSTSATRRPLEVLLVMDESGSMRGKALSDAQSAARAFIAGLRSDDRIGLIGFSDHANVLVEPTTDRAALDSAISSLSAGGETALYDALARAAGSFTGDGGTDHAVVVLSDGGDTVSGHNLGSAASALEASGVPVYAVGLRTGESDTNALRTLARVTGGRLVDVRATAGLAATFRGIAQQLSSPYAVTFTSTRPPSKDLEYAIVATARDARASVIAVVVNPDTLTPQKEALAVPLPAGWWPLLVGVLVFGAVACLAGAVLLLARPEPNAMAHLRYYEQLRAAGRRVGADAQVDPDSVQGRIVGIAGSVASKGGFDAAIRQSLERAGLPLRPVEYMVMHSATVLVVGGLVQLLLHNVLLTGLAIIILALGPILLLQYLIQRRLNAFQEQLPDVLNLLASSLRAGWGLQQAVGVVVTELGPPAAPEFDRVVTEARLGLPLEDALEKMAVRMESEDFRWAVTAIAIQREVGGNLAEVLDMVAATIRERGALRRQISSLTAEGRLSSIILIALPFLEATVLYLMNPRYFAPLLSSPFGLMTAGFGVVLLIVGIVWLRNVVKIEV